MNNEINTYVLTTVFHNILTEFIYELKTMDTNIRISKIDAWHYIENSVCFTFNL